MKVKVSVTIDINPQTWALMYGIEDASEIRADVKEAVTHAVHAYIEGIGAGA